MHLTQPQRDLLAVMQRHPHGMLFDRDLVPNQRAVMTNLLKKGAVIKMLEIPPRMHSRPQVCFVVVDSQAPRRVFPASAAASGDSPQDRAAELIRIALADVLRGDRVDALDSLRMATNVIRGSMPQNQPRLMPDVDKEQLRVLSEFTDYVRHRVKTARRLGLDIICAEPHIRCNVPLASDVTGQMQLEASFDIHIQKKDA